MSLDNILRLSYWTDNAVTAQAAGPALLGDAAWSSRFACATVAALSKPVVRVDVPAMAVSF